MKKKIFTLFVLLSLIAFSHPGRTDANVVDTMTERMEDIITITVILLMTTQMECVLMKVQRLQIIKLCLKQISKRI